MEGRKKQTKKLRSANLIFCQLRANSRLSYREFTKPFNENCEKRFPSNTVRNILFRKIESN